VAAWRDLLGEYLTALLVETRAALAAHGRKLGVGAARGDVVGPPLGNATLAWRTWVREAIVDQLVIDQNSSQCPSMWHQLWPMHRGAGYVHSYLDPAGTPPLVDDLQRTYAPVMAGQPASLYVARQWCARDAAMEREISALPGVAGLVFSSFRHDNPAAIARGDWRAGSLRPALQQQ
jgi:hypothetical protein